MLEGLNEILHKNLEVLSVQYLFILTSVTVFIIVFLHLIMSTLHTKTFDEFSLRLRIMFTFSSLVDNWPFHNFRLKTLSPLFWTCCYMHHIQFLLSLFCYSFVPLSSTPGLGTCCSIFTSIFSSWILLDLHLLNFILKMLMIGNVCCMLILYQTLSKDLQK